MPSLYNQAFGKTLRKFRKRSAFSQEELAELADLSRTYISLMERGLRSPTLDTMMGLCEAMNCDILQFTFQFSNELTQLKFKHSPNQS